MRDDRDIDDFTLVTYHGSIEAARGMRLYAETCDCDPRCAYQLLDAQDDIVLQHVRRTSITPI